ncbi:hypothetical protein DPPLL_30930 [Desulfofustis limnaeus]|uniref:IS1 family transposase n=1 Tax=Desulfofustis limnaeus TaxID=2740163 RepID=A0ABM7WCN8_9BACT|nr:hypothetical protein DPPLL_30930 [Desulfofustis limnaeus]
MRARELGRFSGAGERPRCPRCQSVVVWRCGISRAGKQQYRCKGCGRVFVLSPYLDELAKELAERMIKEKIAVPVIVRVMDGHISRRWIYKRKGELHAE